MWPPKNSLSVDKIALVTEHYIDDFDAGTDTLQLPIEWTNTVIWNLAAELAHEYGLDKDTRGEIIAMARDKKLTIMHTLDVENASVKFEMDLSGGGYA